MINNLKAYWETHPTVRANVGRIIRFGIVGTFCSLVHYIIYCLCLLITNANIAYTAGYAVGLVCNYALTTYFTFHKKPTKTNVAGFVGSHILNYLMEIGLLNLFLWLHISPWFSPILVMVVAVPINFLMLHFVYLHQRKHNF